MAINFSQLLSYRFLGNSLREYLLALVIFVLVISVLKIFKKIVIKKLKHLADHTRIEFDNLLIEILESIGWPFYFLLALWIASQFISLPAKAARFFSYFLLIVVAYYAVMALQRLVGFSVAKLKEAGKLDSSIANLLNQVGKWVLWLIVALVVLQNLGFNVTTLIAGLGIGGIAIAFALQSILSDIFAYFSIHFDKPFETGDFIILDGDLGVVQKIGLKSTRIRTLWGEELVISNKELTEKRVHNYKKMRERRIHFNFGVVYQTPSEKLKKIPQIVTEIFDRMELARLDRVHFKSFGDFSLVFEVAYYILTGDYNKYMDIQQEINFALKERFEKEKIEFAYPTQTIFLEKGA